MWYTFTKRIIDIIGSLTGLLVLSPIFLIVAILNKIDSEGPVFFVQKRCGKGGKHFDMIKFRSMVNDAHSLRHTLTSEVEGSVFKIKDDPRITKFGNILRKTSIDELPQLINVLKGDISLVGPRPLADDEQDGNPGWKKLRLSVKPGITGLWQINSRGDENFDDWVRFDTEYVMNKSLLLDLKILLKTIPVVLTGRGAH